MKTSAVTTLLVLVIASQIAACSGDEEAVANTDRTASQPPNKIVAADPPTQSIYEAGPKFCAKMRPPVIMAAFEFRLKLADVSVAEDFECHYNLDVPGFDMALLIYRTQPIALYEAYRDSPQKSEDITGLGEEAILLGNYGCSAD